MSTKDDLNNLMLTDWRAPPPSEKVGRVPRTQSAWRAVSVTRARLHVDQRRPEEPDVDGMALAYRRFAGTCGGRVLCPAHGRQHAGGQLRWAPGLSFNIKLRHGKVILQTWALTTAFVAGACEK